MHTQTRKPNRKERRASKVGLNPRAVVVPIDAGPLKGAEVIAEPKSDVYADVAEDATLDADEVAVDSGVTGEPGVESPAPGGESDRKTGDMHTGYAPGSIALRTLGLMKVADKKLGEDFTGRNGVYQQARFERMALASIVEELGYMSAQNDVVIEGLKHMVKLLSLQNDMLLELFKAETPVAEADELAFYQAEYDEASAHHDTPEETVDEPVVEIFEIE